MNVKVFCLDCKYVFTDWKRAEIVTINLTSYGKNLQDNPCPRCGSFMWYLEIRIDKPASQTSQ